MSDYKPDLLSHPKRSRRRKRVRKNIFTWFLAGTLIAVITLVTLVYTYYSTRAGLINIDVIREMPQASILYDSSGKPFSRFFDENRIALPMDQPVPKLLAEAVVATEDRRFYDHGGIDILVIASGMNDVAPIGDMEPERFQKVMLANVEGAWLMARSAGKQMIAQGRGGKVVFTSSARGKLGHPAGYSAYCTSKSAVDGMTKALGCEWGKYGITVNAIAPTVFRSPLTAWMFADDDKARAVRAGFLARVPLGRLGEPEDLAGPLLFLCSKASDFYTGHILYADGGYTAG